MASKTVRIHCNSRLHAALVQPCVNERKQVCTVKEILVQNMDLTEYYRLPCTYREIIDKDTAHPKQNRAILLLDAMEQSTNDENDFEEIVYFLKKTDQKHLADLLRVASESPVNEEELIKYVPTSFRHVFNTRLNAWLREKVEVGGSLIAKMSDRHIINSRQAITLRSISDDYKAVDELIEILKKRPNSDFDLLMHCLRTNNDNHIADKFCSALSEPTR